MNETDVNAQTAPETLSRRLMRRSDRCSCCRPPCPIAAGPMGRWLSCLRPGCSTAADIRSCGTHHQSWSRQPGLAVVRRSRRPRQPADRHTGDGARRSDQNGRPCVGRANGAPPGKQDVRRLRRFQSIRNGGGTRPYRRWFRRHSLVDPIDVLFDTFGFEDLGGGRKRHRSPSGSSLVPTRAP